MRPRSLLAAVAVLIAILAVGPALAALAGARPAAAAPAQQGPDAPADDGTGGSNGGSGDEPPAGVQDDDAPADADAPADDNSRDENPDPADGQSILPEPNSGRAPEDAGDRGGVLQALVFVLILAGVGGIAALIVRDARRSRARTQ